MKCWIVLLVRINFFWDKKLCVTAKASFSGSFIHSSLYYYFFPYILVLSMVLNLSSPDFAPLTFAFLSYRWCVSDQHVSYQSVPVHPAGGHPVPGHLGHELCTQDRHTGDPHWAPRYVLPRFDLTLHKLNDIYKTLIRVSADYSCLVTLCDWLYLLQILSKEVFRYFTLPIGGLKGWRKRK